MSTTRAPRAVPGVRQIVVLDDLVAVVGDHMWAAKQGLDALDIAWDDGANAASDDRGVLRRRSSRERSRSGTPMRSPARSARNRPAATGRGSLPAADARACADGAPQYDGGVTADKCEIWVGTQVPARCVAAAAKITGLPESAIVVHNHYMGGGFGRRLETDGWSRPSHRQAGEPTAQGDLDARGGHPPRPVPARSISTASPRASPTERSPSGAITIAGTVDLARWAPPAIKDGLDGDAVDGATELPYDMPEPQVE